MPFSSTEVLNELSRLDHCEACGAYSPDAYDAHSSSQLHLKKITKGNNKGRYKCQSVPDGMQALVGDRGTRTVSVEMGEYFTVIEGRKSDATRLCPKCHDEIHRSAKLWERNLGYEHPEKTVTPELLFQTTLLAVNRCKPIVYDEPVYDKNGRLMRLLGCDEVF